MAWTKEQQKAISYRDGNLLVSAAAGSGKTAVLVERIISRIMDETHPVDIDSIVVVTFTKAAAGEMKARLARNFERQLEENPSNRHLLKQISLIDNARITTIDSFCAYILRNYYNSIGIDPGFLIGDPGELELMKADVLEELLEAKFEEGSREFLDFIETYAPGKTMDAIEDLILRLFTFSQSHPWPEEWLTECADFYGLESIEDYLALPLVKDTYLAIQQNLQECIEEYELCTALCEEAGGPLGYLSAITSDLAKFRYAYEGKDLAELGERLFFEFDKLGRCTKETDPAQKDLVKGIRDRIKKRHEKLIGSYFTETMEEALENIRLCAPGIQMFTALTKEFSLRYSARKSEKNTMDFSDVEHYALQILLRKTQDGVEYTAVADELAGEIEEIYIDEYQDSNMVQELILNAVSKERFGTPNTFMVGDVKQSIYKFRMANPYIFMGKYASYSATDGPFCKVELHNNFRSRENVLESINDVFYKIMKKNIGGVAYTDDARLNAGMTFTDGVEDSTEILFADMGEFGDEKLSSRELCAHMAAKKIRSLMAVRPELNYSDIVILLRSDREAGPVYASILNGHGIPSVHASSTGYFGAFEVKNLLDLLKVIDNPYQEIELASVMRSYFAHFSATELSEIKGRKRRTILYDCLLARAESQDNDELTLKCRDFLAWLEAYRKQSGLSGISELLSDIVYNTGYIDYVGMMNGGSAKRANVEMLIQKAREFQKTSYSGLFHFLRYIYKLHKYDVDYGAAGNKESEDAVRIMSIHKSKGLEFPVVIIGDMGKKYNQMDTNATVLFDPDYGIGTDYIDFTKRIRKQASFKKMIARRMRSENTGEELRVLYVAMTRAVDKLIMIGTCNLKTSQAKWTMETETGRISENYILENTNFLDAVMPCTAFAGNLGKFQVIQESAQDLMELATGLILTETKSFKERIQGFSEEGMEPEIFNRIKEALEFEYARKDVFSVRSKYAVSDLKHQAMAESELPEAHIVSKERIKPLPSFLAEEEGEQAGILRGNAYHKLFEILDYKKAVEMDFQEYLDTLVASGAFSPEYAALIQPLKMERFLHSELGTEMGNAAKEGLLFREQPFIMEVGANEVSDCDRTDEYVLIQGIIDAYYIKDQGIHIVDYKTDKVPDETEGRVLLRERYSKQLELYKRALEDHMGYPVVRTLIYSVSLDKCIDLQYN